MGCCSRPTCQGTERFNPEEMAAYAQQKLRMEESQSRFCGSVKSVKARA